MDKINIQQDKQRLGGTKVARNRLLGIFLILVVLACAAVYSIYKYQTGIDLLKRNYQIDLSVDAATRARWAQRLDLPGLPNFYKVTDELYRGAQPSAEGMQQLEKLGIKTVVNLRSSHSDSDELDGTGLDYEHIKMTTWNVQTEDVARFLRIVSDSNHTPVFVHCKHGSDRTGTLCAIYRIAIEGWSKDEAIEEMTKGGYGFHSVWQNLVDYIRELDINKIKNQADLNS